MKVQGHKPKLCRILQDYCVNTEILTLVGGMKWVLSEKQLLKKIKFMSEKMTKVKINIKQRTSSILFIVVL